jgi:hypothetical protein
MNTMTLRWGALVVIFFCVGLLGTSTLHAQLGFGDAFALSTTPRHPVAGERVTVRAESLPASIEAGELRWYINGVENTAARGKLETSFTAVSIGSETQVRAVLWEDGFEVSAAEIIIRPTQLDLLWESDSYTPLLYRGRALPSAGTNLRMEAIPYFKRTDGTSIAADDIIFTWRRNGYVIGAVSGRGSSRVVLESPPLFGTDIISVEARTADNSYSGETSAQISAIEPVLALYEYHPLFGTLGQRALGAQSSFGEVEVSLIAIPYFVQANTPLSPDLEYAWRVDGNPIPNNETRPNKITVNAEGSTGVALIQLALSHATNLFLNASGSWGITLLDRGAADPFGANP